MMSVRNSITSWLILSMIPTVLADIYVVGKKQHIGFSSFDSASLTMRIN